jgi:hypothetical protein
MVDMLIRGVPESVVIEIDAQAKRLGVSRVEYVRRQLIQDAQRLRHPVTADDLRKSVESLAGLLDDDLMEQAWR